MPVLSTKNAIEKRIDRLTELWNEFAENTEARILRWVIDADSMRLVHGFLQMQQTEASDLPDMILRIDDPMTADQAYGFTLRQSLIEQYERDRKGMGEVGIANEWQAPAMRPGDADIVAVVSTLRSLRNYYGDMLRHVAVALLPAKVTSRSDWANWLQSLLKLELPPNVRWLIVDVAESPLFDELAKADPVRVVTQEPKLNLPGAYNELLNDLPMNGPGAVFRKHFMNLLNAASAKNFAAAQVAADAAQRVASANHWPQMQIVAGMALGAAAIAVGNIDAALAVYRQAHQVAAASNDDPVAPKLGIQSRFAEASALIGQQEYEAAAKVYLDIVPLAETYADQFSLLESWRMAAYCYEQARQYEHSWNSGMKALDVGDAMKTDARETSTLPYVGQGLLRLAQRRPYAEHKQSVRERMEKLLGANWEDKLSTGTDAS